MKLLVVTNLYPPHHIGGYELGCRDIVDGLIARGHEVQVLTSNYGGKNQQSSGHIHRLLHVMLPMPKTRWGCWRWSVESELRNQAALREIIREFNPEVIYIWNLGYTSISLALLAEQSDIPVIYYVSDEWPTRWRDDLSRRYHLGVYRGVSGVLHRATTCVFGWLCGHLPVGPLRLNNAQFTSRFIEHRVLAAGIIPARKWIIPWSIDVKQLEGVVKAPRQWPPTRILYVGQLIEHKGVHTVIEAFAIVCKKQTGHALTLTIAGNALLTPEYESRLRDYVDKHGLSCRVRFLGQVPRDMLPQVYADHDILVFPSIWDEPFSITLVEAMGSGLGIVATSTGGTPEIAQAEVTALMFSPGDASDCARQIVRYISDESLYTRVSIAAAQHVQRTYRLSDMLDAVERSLETVRSAT